MNIKKVIVCLLILILCPTFIACDCAGTNGDNNSNTNDIVDVWFDTASAKVFRQEDVQDKSLKKLSLTMAKNEYEGGQLLMYAKEDVKEYKINASNLVSGNGIIDKSNIAFYNVKYISSSGVSNKYINESLPLDCEMPDALLPFATAEDYGENCIKKGNNQAIYIEVYVPSDTPTGVYFGTITLYVDGFDFKSTLTVNVHDYTLPDEPSTMNYMALWDGSQYNAAELDGTVEMETAYFEALLKYRMSSMLPFYGEGGTEKYVELLRKYYHYSGFCCYKFFYEATYSAYNDQLIAVNLPLLKEYLVAVVRASLEDRVDYLSKAIFYFSTAIDEPGEGEWPKVRVFSTVIHSFLQDIAYELDTSLLTIPNYDFYVSSVRNSLVSIQNTLPCAASIEKLEAEDCADITAINGLQLFNTEADRNSYIGENRKTWFYTCIGPQYPYPNLLANNWLTSVREISWMQMCYGIDGFLVWSTANYTTSDNGGNPVVENYAYLSETMTGVSDGKIFYPGYPYDIYGPVSSLRAVAYRDGMEDYEILKQIYDKYDEQGLDASLVMQEYYDVLFSGVIPNFEASFYSVRETIFALLDNLNTDFAIYYSDIDINKTNATVKFKLQNDKAIVKANNQDINKDNGGIYCVSLNSERANYLDLSITINGVTKNFNKYIFGAYRLIDDFEDEQQDIIAVNVLGSKNVESTNKLYGGKVLNVTLNGTTEYPDFNPWFEFDVSKIDDLEKLNNLCFDVYSDIDIEFDVFARYKSNGINYETSFNTLKIKPGINSFEISVPSNIRTLEGLMSFRLKTDNLLEGDSVKSVSLLIDNVACRYDNKISAVQAKDNGEIVIEKSSYKGRTSTDFKQYKVISNDVSNVIEGDYLMLADFETYNQVAQIKYTNGFGKIEFATDSKYVTHGNNALKCTIMGRGERVGHYDPQMMVYTSMDYFQLENLKNVDYVEIDIYNDMDYDLIVRFNLTWIYFAKGYDYESITLKPGANHVVIQLDRLKACYGDEIRYFCFTFDRGELHEENQVVYIDNFKGHLINK